MQRITRSDVQAQFHAVAGQLQGLGLLDENNRDSEGRTFSYCTGSKTYGNAWRMFLIDPDNGGHHNPPVGSDYLGMTAREAFETLSTIRRTLQDLRYVHPDL